MPHYFYLARCGDGSLYAGTCVDIVAREAKHNAGTGAKYTRAHLPVKIIYTEKFELLTEARKRENQLKKYKGNAVFKRLLTEQKSPSSSPV